MTSSEHRDEQLRDLFRQWFPRIYRIALRWTGEEGQAEDLAQEILLKVLRVGGKFRGKSEFGTWVYRVAFNHCASWRRRIARRERILEQWGKTTPAATIEGPERRLEAEAEAALVRQALARLPVRLKEVLILREVEGQSYGEIARMLRCSIGTVSSRLARARRALRTLLEEDFGWTARS